MGRETRRVAKPKASRKRSAQPKVLMVDEVTKITKLEDGLRKNSVKFVLVYGDWCGACNRFKRDIWGPLSREPARHSRFAVRDDMIGKTSLRNANYKYLPSILVLDEKGNAQEFDTPEGPTNAMPTPKTINDMRRVVNVPVAAAASASPAPASLNSAITQAIASAAPAPAPAPAPAAANASAPAAPPINIPLTPSTGLTPGPAPAPAPASNKRALGAAALGAALGAAAATVAEEESARRASGPTNTIASMANDMAGNNYGEENYSADSNTDTANAANNTKGTPPGSSFSPSSLVSPQKGGFDEGGNLLRVLNNFARSASHRASQRAPRKKVGRKSRSRK